MGDGALLEDEAQTRYFAGDYAAALELYQLAFGTYRDTGDVLGAYRCGRTAWWLHANAFGNDAVANGWIQRAMSLLEDAAEGSLEAGWLAVDTAWRTSDFDEIRRLCLHAVDVARRRNDRDLEVEALGRLGVMLVLSGYTEEGSVYMDEALAAVCSGDARDLSTVEGIFCGLFATCERTHDVTRAEQWLKAADQLVRKRPYVAIAAFCRVHYGGLLTSAGRWPQAERELLEAVRIFEGGYVAARGAALCRLADLRVRQGRLEEAEQLLQGLHEHNDAARPLAALHLACGNIARAQDVLERALQNEMEDAFEGPLQALLIDVNLARGDVAAAETASERLTYLGDNQSSPFLKALAGLARGKVCVASGIGDARSCLNDAVATFARAQLPFDLAHTRMQLAKALMAENPQVAIAEATAALESFEKLTAARDVDAAAALLRSLGAPARTGPKGLDALTKRESEVLDLVAVGLTNAQIGQRLFISPKTVEHHVGRVLAKLGMRSRAEAAAHAVRTPLQRQGDK